MNKLLYCSSISIRNFRPFRMCRVRVPTPGVLLLAGPNGLGKSSFFDAVEWGLTGDVKRLSRARERDPSGDSLYARRRRDGSLSDDFGVDLEYTTGTVRRVATSVSDVPGSYATRLELCESVASLLRSERWSIDISEHALSTYLHQTHLFLQSPSGRFVSRDAKTRWSDIEGPAGVERFMAIQRGLGQATKSALTRRRTQLEKEAETADRQLAAWDALLKRRDALKSQAASGGGLAPHQAEESIRQLETGLDLVVADRTLGQRLKSLFQKIQEEEILLNRQRNTIEEGREIVRVFGEISGTAEELGRQCEEQSRILLERSAELEALRAERSKHHASIENVLRTLRSHEVRLEQTAALQSAQAKKQEISRSVEESNKQIHAAKTELGELRRKVQRTRAEVVEIERSRQLRQELLARRLEVSALSNTVTGLLTRMDVSQGWKQERLHLIEEIRSIEEDLTEQREELLVQQEAVEKVKDELVLETRRRDTIKAAVSSIAANLVEHAHECPVCKMDYSSSDELQRRIESALKDGGEDLVRLEKSVLAEEALATELRDRIDVTVGSVRQMKIRSAELADGIDQVTREWEAVLASPLLLGVDIDTPAGAKRYIDEVKRRTEESLGSLAPLHAEQARMLELQTALTSLSKQEQSLEAREAALQQELSRQETQRRSVEALVTGSREISGGDGTALEDVIARLASEAEATRKSHVELVSRGTEVEAKVAREDAQVHELRMLLAKLRQQIDDCTRRKDSAQGRWRQLGLQGEVSGDTLNAVDSEYRGRLQHISNARVIHSQISDGVSRWAAEAQLSEAEQEIEKTLVRFGSDNIATVSQRLHEDAADAHRRLGDVRTVAFAVNWLDRKLKDEMDKYVPNLLDPLNLVAERVLDSLSVVCGQRVQMRAPRHGSVYPVSLRVLGEFVDDALGVSPQEMLSEGQLAFVSLGIMISMSLIYRWSDWRCLLLDDPFQNNDIIRIAALLDLLRGLCCDMGYQVILSTHDLGLADFLHRKFTAGGVDTEVCRLVSATDDGVIIE